MIKALFNEFVKNIKIMFRNITALSLLIIAPLIIILLIGYAFSGEELNHIKIGIIGDNSLDLSGLTSNLSSAEFIDFSSIDDCIANLKLQEMHLCIVTEGALIQPKNFSEFETLKVHYYYDNTRKKVSLAIISGVQNYFGVKSEQVSIETTEKIINNILNLIGFINDRKTDILAIKNESQKIKNDLISRDTELRKIRDDFIVPYVEVKKIQEEVHNYSGLILNASEIFFASSKNLEDNIININSSLSKTDNASIFIEKINATFLNTSLTNLTASNSNLTLNVFNDSVFLDALKSIKDIENATNSTVIMIASYRNKIDEIVLKLDFIKTVLDAEIERNTYYIDRIDKSTDAIDNITLELDLKLASFSSLDPSFAKDLIKPVLHEYSVLLPGAKNIELTFPQLFTLILMFIALLLSNISMLMEIHSIAALRNNIAPVTYAYNLVGMFITNVFLVFIQISVLFFIAETKLGVSILEHVYAISFVTLLLISVFVLIGMIFAYLFSSVQSSILMTTFSALIIFLFGNSFAPIESMPDTIGFFAQNNPLVKGEYLITQIQLYGNTVFGLTPDILLMLFYITLLFIALFFTAKKRIEK